MIKRRNENRMNSSQYKNVIQYTLADETNKGKDSLELTRSILDNLGVPFPNGGCGETLHTLMDGDYMDWVQCFKSQAHQYANRGFATVGFSKDNVFVIEPDAGVLTLGTGIEDSANPVARTIGEISQDELDGAQFFSYAVPPQGGATAPTAPMMSTNSWPYGGGGSSGGGGGYSSICWCYVNNKGKWVKCTPCQNTSGGGGGGGGIGIGIGWLPPDDSQCSGCQQKKSSCICGVTPRCPRCGRIHCNCG